MESYSGYAEMTNLRTDKMAFFAVSRKWVLTKLKQFTVILNLIFDNM